ncbi:hypothetical protein LINGRAHAP2_LOCUS20337 [Linum grandiflorum]
MVDLESEVFLAIFEESSDYYHALTGGPWTILDHYLVVFAWDSQFRVTDDLPQKMVVWIRFPRLPYQYYQCDVLQGLGNLVGKFVRFDTRTQHSVRGKFARIAVEIDLTAPAPKGVYVDGIWQVVEYENLPSFCSICGRFGHSSESYDRHSGSTISDPVVSKHVEAVQPVRISYSGDAPVEPDGPWQMVMKKRWRPKMASAPSSNGSAFSSSLGKGKMNQPNPRNLNHGMPSQNYSASLEKQAGVNKQVNTRPADSILNKKVRPANEARVPKARLAHSSKAASVSDGSGLSSSQKQSVPVGGLITRSGRDLRNKSDGPTPKLVVRKSNPVGTLGTGPNQDTVDIDVHPNSISSMFPEKTSLSAPISTSVPKLSMTTPADISMIESVSILASTDFDSQLPLLNKPSSFPVTATPMVSPVSSSFSTKDSFIGTTNKRPTISRSLLGVSIHWNKVISPARGKKKKKTVSSLVDPSSFSTLSAAALATTNWVHSLPPKSNLAPTHGIDSVGAKADIDFDASSVDEEATMCTGHQDDPLIQNDGHDPTCAQI